uniref:Uncharacterized protein n=1 Tax=Arundo donax TaxID=35708 RepID=A0A0A8ZPG0_ARUDO
MERPLATAVAAGYGTAVVADGTDIVSLVGAI